MPWVKMLDMCFLDSDREKFLGCDKPYVNIQLICVFLKEEDSKQMLILNHTVSLFCIGETA